MTKWGYVSAYVEEVFDEMTKELESSESKISVFRSHAETSGFNEETVKKANRNLEKKKSKATDPNAKSHGNSTLTLQEEAMTMSWLLMKSEIGKADQIKGIQTFVATFQDTPLSKKAAKNLFKKYSNLFRVTSERSMTNARTDPIN